MPNPCPSRVLAAVRVALVGFASAGSVATVPASPALARTEMPSARLAPQNAFASFVASLWPAARAHGVSRATFEAAFAGVEPDPDVMAATRRQAEFVKTTGQYLATAVSDKRIASGKARYGDWAPWFARAEKRFGVDRYVILGVWGLETNFGQFPGGKSTIQALATLAYHRYRGDYFRRELLTALDILQARHIDAAHMTGSWAGATGQTQFMPSSFRAYAVDFDGDGRRDIWTSIPDAIGSTANYLHKHGWVAGESWGYEVRLPAGVTAQDGTRASFAAWTGRGITRADGGDMPRSGTGTLLMPEGRGGPTFLVTPNFKVIKSYNNSTSYALGVSLLGDRIAGWGDLKGRWPSAGKPPRRRFADRD